MKNCPQIAVISLVAPRRLDLHTLGVICRAYANPLVSNFSATVRSLIGRVDLIVIESGVGLESSLTIYATYI